MCDKTRMAENLIDEYMNLMDKIKKGETLTPEELNAFAQRSILKTVGSMHEMLVGMNNKLARMAENERFMKKERRAANKKEYKYLSCPHCKQEMRVPRGKGKIAVKCPKCGESTITRS